VYLLAAGERAQHAAPRIAEALRDALPGRGVIQNLGGGNFAAQFRRADKCGAQLAVVLGDAEIERGVAAVKPLRREGGQSECPIADLPRGLPRSYRRGGGRLSVGTGTVGAAERLAEAERPLAARCAHRDRGGGHWRLALVAGRTEQRLLAAAAEYQQLLTEFACNDLAPPPRSTLTRWSRPIRAPATPKQADSRQRGSRWKRQGRGGDGASAAR
jgi:hypothetical protein